MLFGGQLCPPFQSCTPYGDTWEWDGAEWLQRAASGPAARAWSALAFDRNRSRSVLFSGAALTGFPADTWEWDGAEWIERFPSPSLLSRQGHALAFDPGRGRTILFGGLDRSVHVTSETWEYFAPCDTLGPGHPGGGLAIGCSATPRIGAGFCVEFSDPLSAGTSMLAFGPGPCLVPPAPLSGPAFCEPGFLWVRHPYHVRTSSGSSASFCASLPNQTALIGTSFCVQGAVRESGGCWRLTDGLSLTVQP